MPESLRNSASEPSEVSNPSQAPLRDWRSSGRRGDCGESPLFDCLQQSLRTAPFSPAPKEQGESEESSRREMTLLESTVVNLGATLTSRHSPFEHPCRCHRRPDGRRLNGRAPGHTGDCTSASSEGQHAELEQEQEQEQNKNRRLQMPSNPVEDACLLSGRVVCHDEYVLGLSTRMP